MLAAITIIYAISYSMAYDIKCYFLGAFVAGITAIIPRYILYYQMVSEKEIHIKTGDMAMSFGIFSLIICLYFSM